jgi:hypothetical protein
MFKIYFKKAFSLFCILGFLFIPLTFFGADYQYRLTRFLFLHPVTFIQDHCFPHAIKNIEFSSDTISLNILLGLLLLLSFLLVFILGSFRISLAGIPSLFKCISIYYIAAVLLKYGFDKVFKRQFYLPEPNIRTEGVFTGKYLPLGQTHELYGTAQSCIKIEQCKKIQIL